jgi:hypothetical protein
MTDFDVELASVRTALASALAEKGEDYVYERPEILQYDDDEDRWFKSKSDGCVYLEPVFDEDDTITGYVPSCLWGHVLLTLGITKEELLEHEDECIDWDGMPVPWSSALISAAASEAQDIQDGGGTWSRAVKAFEDVVDKRAGAL